MEEKKKKALQKIEAYDENFEDIKDLIFTDKMKRQSFTEEQQKLIIKNFYKLKEDAIKDASEGAKINFVAAFVLYRILNNKAKINEPIIQTLNKLSDYTDKKVEELNKKCFISFPWTDFKDYLDTMEVK